MDIDSLLAAIVMNQSAEEVSSENSQQLRTCTQQRQIVRNIARHAAVADFHVPRIGIRCDESIVKRCRQIDVRSAYNRDECFHVIFLFLFRCAGV